MTNYLSRHLQFHLKYFLLAIALFITELIIGIYAHDNIVRPYGGDLLVVILIYFFVKAFINSPVLPTAIAVLVFAYVIEILQYFHFVRLLGLQHSRLACIILGTSFSWTDMLMYTVGIGITLGVEKILRSATGKQV